MSQKWQFEITDIGEEDLAKLSPDVGKRILEKLKWLIGNFEDIAPVPLGGNWHGFFKLRVGDWRVVYEVEEKKRLVTVHYIEHRDKIYTRRPPFRKT